MVSGLIVYIEEPNRFPNNIVKINVRSMCSLKILQPQFPALVLFFGPTVIKAVLHKVEVVPVYISYPKNGRTRFYTAQLPVVDS